MEYYGSRYIDIPADPPDMRDAITASSERLLLTSIPAQDLFMTMRRIARWENPVESGTYMVIYLMLVLSSNVMTALVRCILLLYTSMYAG